MTLLPLALVLAVAAQAPATLRTGAVSGALHEGGRGGTVVVLEEAPVGRPPRRYTAMMNGRGEYRVFGILPGRYRVFATTLRGSDDVPRWGIVEPIAHAQIEIRGGEDLGGADFVAPSWHRTVSGRVASSPETSPSIMLTLVSVTQPETPLWTRLVPAGSDFAIDGVLPGAYELRTSQRGDPVPLGTSFSVGATNVTGLRIGSDSTPPPAPRAAAPDPPAPTGPTGGVSGHVYDADTGQPLAGATVAAQTARSTKTDSDGRYTLAGVPAGSASVRVDDGLRWPGLTVPRDVAIETDRETRGVDFRVRLFGSISGRVVSEQGEPLAGVRVFAIRREYGNAAVQGQQLAHGALFHFIQAQAVTDDRGQYEFERLFAGRLYWVLAYRPRSTAGPASSRALAATYHPSGSSLETGLGISLRSGERREFVDVRMRSLPSFCADAVLTRDGQPAAVTYRVEEEDVARLEIIAGSPTTQPWRQSGMSGSDGRARVCGLAEGRHRLTAEVSGTLRRDAVGVAVFDVTDRDVNLGVVDVAAPIRLSGEMRWDPPPGDATERPLFRLNLASFPSVPVVADPQVPGTFSFTAFPGHYGLVASLNGGPSLHPFYVRDVQFGDASALEGGVRITGPGQALIVTLGADAGSIVVRVADSSGRPVPNAGVLVVADATGGGANAVIVRAGHADAQGLYRADGLAPGRYDVVAPDALPPFLVYRPSLELHVERSPEALEAISRARPRGARVTVPPSGSVAVTVTPVSLD